jgi:hypothetical protein
LSEEIQRAANLKRVSEENGNKLNSLQKTVKKLLSLSNHPPSSTCPIATYLSQLMVSHETATLDVEVAIKK